MAGKLDISDGLVQERRQQQGVTEVEVRDYRQREMKKTVPMEVSQGCPDAVISRAYLFGLVSA
jgi:hypothetical protein